MSILAYERFHIIRLARKHIDYAAIFSFTQSIAAALETENRIRKPEFASHVAAPVAL